jgi:hypothetical protein
LLSIKWCITVGKFPDSNWDLFSVPWFMEQRLLTVLYSVDGMIILTDGLEVV